LFRRDVTTQATKPVTIRTQARPRIVFLATSSMLRGEHPASMRMLPETRTKAEETARIDDPHTGGPDLDRRRDVSRHVV
jgi:hypothetical protein